MRKSMKKIAILASGRGSNFQAIADAIQPMHINGEIIALFSDNKDAYAIERAKNLGIKTYIYHYKDYPSKAAFEADLLSGMKSCGADLFLCAGYMRIIGSEIARTFAGKMINIHPALLPAFPGLHSQKQALDYGTKVAGCTVHFVDEGLDSGAIIVQKVVPVLEGDTEDSLADRILEQEHIAFPEAVKLFCDDRLKIEGRIVHILPEN